MSRQFECLHLAADETPPAFVEWVVEVFFGELKRRVYETGAPPTLSALKARVRKACRDPSMFDWLRNAFDSMPKRIQAVIEKKGWHTGY